MSTTKNLRLARVVKVILDIVFGLLVFASIALVVWMALTPLLVREGGALGTASVPVILGTGDEPHFDVQFSNPPGNLITNASVYEAAGTLMLETGSPALVIIANAVKLIGAIAMAYLFYLLRKIARRHRALVASGLVAVLSILVGAGVAIRYAVRIAEKNSELLKMTTALAQETKRVEESAIEANQMARVTQAVNDFLSRQSVCDELNCVGCLHQTSDRARRVLPITLLLLPQHVLQTWRLAALVQLFHPPPSPLFR